MKAAKFLKKYDAFAKEHVNDQFNLNGDFTDSYEQAVFVRDLMQVKTFSGERIAEMQDLFIDADNAVKAIRKFQHAMMELRNLVQDDHDAKENDEVSVPIKPLITPSW